MAQKAMWKEAKQSKYTFVPFSSLDFVKLFRMRYETNQEVGHLDFMQFECTFLPCPCPMREVAIHLYDPNDNRKKAIFFFRVVGTRKP